MNIVKQNLEIVLNRNKGDKYYLENGSLKLMNWGQRLVYSLSSSCPLLFGNSAARNAENVKVVLSNALDEVENHFNDEEIQTLFFNKLSSLSQRIYERRISRSIEERLLQKVSISELDELEGVEALSENYKTTYKVAKLWAKLGSFKLLGGTCGTYQIYKMEEIDGVFRERPLGVCKISEEEQLAPNNPRWIQKLKRFLYWRIAIFSRGILFKMSAGQAYLAEAANRIVERQIVKIEKSQNEYISETHTASIALAQSNEKKCSFQLWVEESVQADQFLNVTPFYQPKGGSPHKELDKSLFFRLVMIDYITGNHDRHGENWFVVDKDGRQEIRLIDGGSSMAPHHPYEWSLIVLNNQYKWRNLLGSHEHFPIDLTFGEAEKGIIDDLWNQRGDLESQIRRFYDTHNVEGAIPKEGKLTCENQERVDRMIERLRVLHFMKDHPIRELANIRTNREFEKLALQFSILEQEPVSLELRFA